MQGMKKYSIAKRVFIQGRLLKRRDLQTLEPQQHVLNI